jgi:Domain of unknown function (DUF4375)
MSDETSDAFAKACDLIDIYKGPEVFLRTFASVDQNIGLLYAAHFVQSEVCNGGFKQFFGNSTGVLAPEAIRGFELIGMTETAQVVRVGTVLLGEPYPRDRAYRKTVLSQVSNEELRRLDEQFFERLATENGGFESASAAFASNLK